LDNALLIGLTRQSTLRRQLDVIANNIANMNTAGFKVERPAFQEVSERPARHQDGPRPIRFVEDWALARDFSAGALEKTGSAFDVAIETQGFLSVMDEASREIFLTRDGRLQPNSDGVLVTQTGHTVLDDERAPITLDLENAQDLVINRDGTLVQGGEVIARLGILDVTDRSQLTKQGDNLFRADEAALVQPEELVLRQGFLEASNVQPILEMTRMMETNRAYDSASKMIRAAEELKRKAIEKLAG
jgi:flagellar basal-body rod protein FlgF